MYISLMTDNLEHLFICSFSICIFSLVRCGCRWALAQHPQHLTQWLVWSWCSTNISLEIMSYVKKKGEVSGRELFPTRKSCSHAFILPFYTLTAYATQLSGWVRFPTVSNGFNSHSSLFFSCGIDQLCKGLLSSLSLSYKLFEGEGLIHFKKLLF